MYYFKEFLSNTCEKLYSYFFLSFSVIRLWESVFDVWWSTKNTSTYCSTKKVSTLFLFLYVHKYHQRQRWWILRLYVIFHTMSESIIQNRNRYNSYVLSKSIENRLEWKGLENRTVNIWVLDLSKLFLTILHNFL